MKLRMDSKVLFVIVCFVTMICYAQRPEPIRNNSDEIESEAIPIDTLGLRSITHKLPIAIYIKHYGKYFSVTPNKELLLIVNGHQIAVFDSSFKKNDLLSFPIHDSTGNYILDCFSMNPDVVYVSLQHWLYRWDFRRGSLKKLGKATHLEYNGSCSLITTAPDYQTTYYQYTIDSCLSNQSNVFERKTMIAPTFSHMGDNIVCDRDTIYEMNGVFINKETNMALALGLDKLHCMDSNYQEITVDFLDNEIKADNALLLGVSDSHYIFKMSFGNSFLGSPKPQGQCTEYLVIVKKNLEIERIIYLDRKGINIVPKILRDDQYIVQWPSGILYHYSKFTDAVHIVCFTPKGVYYGLIPISRSLQTQK